MYLKTQVRFLCAIICLLALCATNFPAQEKTLVARNEIVTEKVETKEIKSLVVSVLPNYYSAQDGVSINELIKRALDSNQDLTAARLEIDFCKTDAGFSPTINF